MVLSFYAVCRSAILLQLGGSLTFLTQIWEDCARVMDRESYVKRRKVQTSDWDSEK